MKRMTISVLFLGLILMLLWIPLSGFSEEEVMKTEKYDYLIGSVTTGLEQNVIHIPEEDRVIYKAFRLFCDGTVEEVNLITYYDDLKKNRELFEAFDDNGYNQGESSTFLFGKTLKLTALMQSDDSPIQCEYDEDIRVTASIHSDAPRINISSEKKQALDKEQILLELASPISFEIPSDSVGFLVFRPYMRHMKNEPTSSDEDTYFSATPEEVLDVYGFFEVSIYSPNLK